MNGFDSGDTRATTIMVETGQGWWKEDSVAGTLRSEGENRPSRPSHVVPRAVRRLTPVECERLQGFPDDWTAIGSDSARYKQMGNAVTVNAAQYVAALIDTAVRESA